MAGIRKINSRVLQEKKAGPNTVLPGVVTALTPLAHLHSALPELQLLFENPKENKGRNSGILGLLFFSQSHFSGPDQGFWNTKNS